MKKNLSIFVATLIVGFISGWILKPNPPVLTKNTVTLAKWYCEETLNALPRCKEAAVMRKALDNLNEDYINLTDQFDPDRVSYKMVQLFAHAQEVKKTIRLLPQPSPTAAELSLR